LTAGNDEGGKVPRVTWARLGRVVHVWRPALLAVVVLVGVLPSASASASGLISPLQSFVAAAETAKAPKITKQPAGVTVEEGQNATFTAVASGTPTPTAQWEISSNGGASWSAIEGATSASVTIVAAKTSENGELLRVVFKNAAGEATSAAGVLTVHAAPAITKQPASVTLEAGQSTVLEAAASGLPAPTVQWELSTNNGSSFSAISGATSNQLTIASVKTTESGHEYRATFKNVSGKAVTEAVTLTVRVLPAVTKQPVALTVLEGQGAVFEAAASGFPAPTVQWQISADGGASWSAIEGAISTSLTIVAAKGSESGELLRAVFKNAAGEVVTSAVSLTVHSLPAVTKQPAGETVEEGQGATFEALASGSPTPSVQWELSTNGGSSWSAIEGATSSQLTIASVKLAESGREYRVTFTNVVGKATSAAATLTVATYHYKAVAWGQNLFRQLGDGTTNAFSDIPVTVSGLRFVASVAAGGRHSLALLAGGTVDAWGDNEYGQLGAPKSVITSDVPIPVPGLTGVKAISAGANHSLALLANGTVMAWGGDESGQLGIGAIKEGEEVPTAVKGLSGVKAVSAGASHSLALLANGTVMAWGSNESGQLGTGNLKSSTVPVAVKGLTGVTAIAAGANFSLALLPNGTVVAWGSNEFGQLASGSIGEEQELSNVPVQVGTLTGVTAIAAGAEHGLALMSDHTVMAWGEDTYGEIGVGVIQPRQETPVAVGGLSGVTAISAGAGDSVALLSNGSVMAWGINEWGTLGDGSIGAPSDVPVAVSGLGSVVGISAGGSQVLADSEPIPAVTEVSPSNGPAGGGNTVTLTGVNFTGATSVRFGTVAAASFTVTSPTTATAVVPAGKGIVDVTIATAAGISPTGPVDRYTYMVAPVVTKISVKTGPAAGGTSVTITGKELTGATGVSFGASPAVSFTVNSATSITATAPPGAAGTVDVTVTAVGGTSAISAKDRFKYVPVVTGISPNSGSVAGGATVTVTGAGFLVGTAGTTLKFGTKKSSSVDCTTTTSCTAVVPANPAGAVNVTAQVNKATSAVNKPGDEFTYD
jgi:alpha-tubulin suppressor-like RCC1 family protein